MTELLDSKEIHSIETRMIALLDRTFLKSTKLETLDYKKELIKNVRYWFKSKTFELQLDSLITELIKFSLLYADGQMKILTAAKVKEGTILTKEAIARATDISETAAKSIIRMLEDDAIYYEGPAKLGRRIEDLWDGQRHKAVSFAHTFSADVATATTVYRYRQYGVQFMEFSAKIDERTTDQCRCLHGTVFDLSKDSVDKYRAPLHHRCRSALLPIPNTREPQNDMIFENRDFSGTLDNPDDVKKVFGDIDKFNQKYRVSGYVIDQDLSTRVMLEKGVSVGIDTEIPIAKKALENEAIRISKNTISRLPKTHYEIVTELKTEGMYEFDSQVRFLQSVLKNKQWHNVTLNEDDVQTFKQIYVEYLTEAKKYKDYTIHLSSLSDDDLLKEYKLLQSGKQKKAVFDWYSENDMGSLDSIVTEALGYGTKSSRLTSLAELSTSEREQATKSYYAMQEYLKRKYPSGRITVYRGVTSDTYKELAKEGIDSSVDVEMYNLSCWTENPAVAKGFTVSSDGGVVLKADIPIERVYLHYDISDPLHDFEKEISVMGDEITATVDDIRDAKETYTRKEKIEMELEKERLRNIPKPPKKKDVPIIELDFDDLFG